MESIKISCIVTYFRGEKYLEQFLENVQEQSALKELELVFIHNEPNEKELAFIETFKNKAPWAMNHIVVDPVEPNSVSMNRAIENAKGEYVAIWNVDDLRAHDSLSLQMKTLDENPDVGLVYGDYMVVDHFGKRKGRAVVAPEFRKKEFQRSMHCGPFPMWRKELHSKYGLFDEQLIQGADFDLMLRFAFNINMKRANGLLGYYLDEGKGLSTRKNGLQEIERTAIELRHGIYEKVAFPFYIPATKYNLHSIKREEEWLPVEQFIPNYESLIKHKKIRLLLNSYKAPYQYLYILARSIKRKIFQ